MNDSACHFHPSIACVAAALSLLALTSFGAPSNAAWAKAQDGGFEDKSAWSSAEAPGDLGGGSSGAIANIQASKFSTPPAVSQPFTISFNRDETTAGAIFDGDLTLTLDLNGHTWNPSPYNVQMGSAAATPEVTVVDGTFISAGAFAVKAGTLRVGPDMTLTSGDTMSVGTEGAASVIVDGGKLNVGSRGNRTFDLDNTHSATLEIRSGSVACHTLALGEKTTLAIALHSAEKTPAVIQASHQLQAAGSLDISLGSDFSAGAEEVFELISFSGFGGYTGQFSNLGEGETLTVGDYTFRISYGEDVKNTVTLTVAEAAAN